MKNFLYNLKLKRDFDRVQVLQWVHFFLILFGILLEISVGVASAFVFGKIIFFLIFYKLYFQTLKGLLYTYWSFSFFLQLYLIVGMYDGAIKYEVGSLFYCSLLSMMVLGIQQFILFSPIYYPRVRWWEYDFRYRDDVKIKIKKDGEKKVPQEINGRLTDLRRHAGCVVSFDQFQIGDNLHIYSQGEFKELVLHCEIMSQRIYSIGRGINYGVKFHFKGLEEKRDFLRFCKFWKKERSKKMELKFKEDSIS